MPRMVFINLCVKDLTASTKFFTSIGAHKNEMFSNETVSCMVFSDAIHVMLLTPPIFTSFTPPSKTLADPTKVSEVLICLSVDAREDVDAMIEKVKAEGGSVDPTVMPSMDGMYGRSFEDLDGHVWEVMWMDVPEAGKEGEGKGSEGGAAGVV